MSAPEQRSLLLVRHGRTAANAKGLLLGREDPPLDDTGLQQAAQVAASVRSGAYGRILGVVASPLQRTRQTAAAFGHPVTIDDRLVELDYGEYDGTPVNDVPVEVWQRWQSDLAFAPPGGESIAALGHRVRAACDDWASRLDEPGTIVLVTHVSPIKAAAAWALGVGDEVCWRTHLDTASISRALVRGGRPVLDLFNETSHLR
ncbi:MAG: histidine phosphatase family protein [Actinomycetota bacterium]|nr:histidine phosphatase family protein [Actinomycetota bacterium]